MQHHLETDVYGSGAWRITPQGEIAGNVETGLRARESVLLFERPIASALRSKCNVRCRRFEHAVATSGERRIFCELQRCVILVRFFRAKEEHAEGMSGPAVINEPAIEPFFLDTGLFVD